MPLQHGFRQEIVALIGESGAGKQLPELLREKGSVCMCVSIYIYILFTYICRISKKE